MFVCGERVKHVLEDLEEMRFYFKEDSLFFGYHEMQPKRFDIGFLLFTL